MSDTLEQKWKQLDQRRRGKLNRARELASLTIPSLLPDEGLAQDAELPVPYNSLPAEGTNALASRITSIMLPINGTPPVELMPMEDLEFQPTNNAEAITLLRRIERIAYDQLKPTNFRASVVEMMMHLLIIGDVLLEELDDMEFRLYRLDQYVVRRDRQGRWREVIVREEVDPYLLPDNMKALLDESVVEAAGKSPSKPKQHYLFTRWWRDDAEDEIQVGRELNGKIVTEDEDFQDSFQVSPIFPMRWFSITGEDYGRSLAEDMVGDLRMLDILTKALHDGSIMSTDFRWLVDPAGLTEITDWNNSESGDAIPGREQDINAKTADGMAQVQAAQMIVSGLERKIARRMLMNSALQRDAERVTLGEIRILAQDLEQGLGGSLAMFGSEVIAGVFMRTLDIMTQKEQLPSDMMNFLIGDEKELTVKARAGLEALNKEAETERIMQLFEVTRNLPEQAQRVPKWGELLRRLINNIGLDAEAATYSEEELMAQQQAEQQQMMAQQQQVQAQQAAMQAAQAADQQGAAQ